MSDQLRDFLATLDALDEFKDNVEKVHVCHSHKLQSEKDKAALRALTAVLRAHKEVIFAAAQETVIEAFKQQTADQEAALAESQKWLQQNCYTAVTEAEQNRRSITLKEQETAEHDQAD